MRAAKVDASGKQVGRAEWRADELGGEYPQSATSRANHLIPLLPLSSLPLACTLIFFSLYTEHKHLNSSPWLGLQIARGLLAATVLPEETTMTGMIAPMRKLADDLTTAVQVGTRTKSAETGTEMAGNFVTKRETGTKIEIDPGEMIGIGIEKGTETGETAIETTETTGGGGMIILGKTTAGVGMTEIEMTDVMNYLARIEGIVIAERGREHLHLEITDIPLHHLGPSPKTPRPHLQPGL